MADRMTPGEVRAVARASRAVLTETGTRRGYTPGVTPTQSIAELAEQIGALKGALRTLIAAVEALEIPEADR